MNKKFYGPKTFIGNLRRFADAIIPKRFYKTIYFYALKFQAKARNKRKEKLCFQIDIVNGCNLNCAMCGVFAPLRNKELTVIETYEKDVRRIGELSDGNIESLTFQGGEPLMHPQITEFFEVTRKYIKIGEVAVVSNGILLSKLDESFWESCKINDINIYITPYPINLNRKKIDEMAEKYSVRLEYACAGVKSYFSKRPLNINGNFDIVENFKKCSESKCQTLHKGKMYTCATLAFVGYFNEYFGQNFEVTNKDYIDIYEAKNVDEILDFLCKPQPFCRYCDMDAMELRVPWKVSKKDISEWM